MDMAEAGTIARALVEERLVACANMFVISSVFRWEGKVEQEPEAAIICKTVTEKVPAVIKRVKELHSYETPCITSWKVDSGSEAYLDWVRREAS